MADENRSTNSQKATETVQLDNLAKEFESAWKKTQPLSVISEYLPRTVESRRLRLLAILALSDFELRLQDNQSVRIEEYLTQFETLAENQQAVMELIATDYTYRKERGAKIEDYGQRFPEFRDDLPAFLNGMPLITGYTLLQKIGYGGMADVFKARCRRLKRVVALKTIKSGVYASKAAKARFQTEANAVAAVQHPNIVQIFETGEHNQSTYIALEFVEGGSLDARIAGKPLPPREAAELLLPVAEAMHLAHSRGVVHRDLKPANVLLTADGTPKVTDFGLAKKQDEDNGQTQSGDIIGTPSYMAPELVDGPMTAVGPPADVYGLGAIFYHCLTGKPPFQGDTALATLDLVRSTEPAPPSQFQKKLPRDVEVICLKCLSKEPEKRYASAKELAEDLRRYVCDEPILARRTGLMERASKFRKRRPALAVLMVMGAVLVSVITISMVLLINAYFRVDKAREDAVIAQQNEHQRLIQVRQLAREIIFDLLPVLERLPGNTQIRKSLADAVLARLNELRNAAADDAPLLKEIATAYDKLGDVQGHPAVANLGNTSAALANYRLAEEIRIRLAALDPASLDYLSERAISFDKIGDILQSQGNHKAAIENYNQALDIRLKVAKTDSSNELFQTNLAASHDRIGTLLLGMRNIPKAQASLQESFRILQNLADREPNNLRRLDNAAAARSKLGVLHRDRQQYDLSLAEFKAVLENRRSLAEARPDDIRFQSSLAIAYQHLGTVQEKKGQLQDALLNYSESEIINRRLFEADEEDVKSRRDFSATRNLTGDLYWRQKNNALALTCYQEVYVHAKWLHEHDKNNAQYQDDLAISHFKLAAIYSHIGEDEALEKSQRVQHWREAKKNGQVTFDILTEMEQCGTITRASKEAIKQLPALLAECDEKIAELEKK